MKKIILFLLIIDIILILILSLRHILPANALADSNTDNQQKKVALTFDDGPHEEYTNILLDGLRSRNVKATFFVVGKSVEENPYIIHEMHNDGHLIANHTYSHVNLSTISHDDALSEISRTNALIKSITGEDVIYIRPPFGAWNEELINDSGMKIALWDVDPRDWNTQNTEAISTRVLNNINNGDIIILHDVYDSSVYAAFNIIDALKSKGFSFVTIDEIF